MVLETTTHIKYWDYSHVKLNIKGRVCLPVSLFWGVMSYVAVFWIHPPVARLFARIPMWLQYTLCGSFFTLLAVDTVTTVRKLALVTWAMNKLQTAGDELRLQMAFGQGRSWRQYRGEVGEQLRQKLDGVRGSLPLPQRNVWTGSWMITTSCWPARNVKAAASATAMSI